MGKEILQPAVYDWLTKETSLDLDLLKMSDVATYVHIARYHDMKLKFEVTDEHFRWCQAASDQFTYEWFGATPEYWYLANRQQLEILSELVDVVFDGAAPNTKTIINTNLYSQGSGWSNPDMPYFWLLLGHQETLWPLSKALGLEVAAKLPFSASFFFEFMTKDSKDYVNMVYRDDKGKTEGVQLECSPSETDTACEKEKFKSFIDTRIAVSKLVDCNTPYPDKNHEYYDVDKFINELLEDLNLTKPKKDGGDKDNAVLLRTAQFATAGLFLAAALF